MKEKENLSQMWIKHYNNGGIAAIEMLIEYFEKIDEEKSFTATKVISILEKAKVDMNAAAALSIMAKAEKKSNYND